MEEPRPSRPFIAVLIAAGGVAVLTALAAWVPAEVRKLVLFSVAFGLCAGGVVLWSARECGLERRWAVTLTLPLIVIGLILIGLRGHQQLLAEVASTSDSPEQKMARHILAAAAEGDPELARELEERESRSRPSFADYLAVRVRPLGEWRQPGPTLFWGAELLLATAAGAFLVWRQLRLAPEPVEKHR